MPVNKKRPVAEVQHEGEAEQQGQQDQQDQDQQDQQQLQQQARGKQQRLGNNDDEADGAVLGLGTGGEEDGAELSPESELKDTGDYDQSPDLARAKLGAGALGTSEEDDEDHHISGLDSSSRPSSVLTSAKADMDIDTGFLGVQSASKKCKCGSADHQKSSHRDCPLRKQRLKRRQLPPSMKRAFKMTPTSFAPTVLTSFEAVQVRDRHLQWIKQDDPQTYELRYEEDLESEVFSERFREHITEVVTKLKAHVQAQGFSSLTPLAIFRLVGGYMVETVKSWMAVKADNSALGNLDDWEFCAFLATMLTLDAHIVSKDKALQRARILVKYELPTVDDIVPSLYRFNQLLNLFRAAGPENIQEDRSSWTHSPANVELMRKYEAGMYMNPLRLTASKHLTVVLGDETVGRRTTTKSVGMSSTRGEEQPSTMVNEAFLSLAVAVEHNSQQEGASPESTSDVLERVLANLEPSQLEGLWVAGRGAHSGLSSWLRLSTIGASFVMESSNGDHPVTLTSEVRGHQGPQIEYDDSAMLGSNIVWFTCKVPGVDNANDSNLSAFVVRDYSFTPRKTGEAKVLRFVESGTGLDQKLRKTFCMVKRRLPIDTDARRVLFFPCKQSIKYAATKELESILKTTCTPLTCWKYSAEWHLLKMFTITSDVGFRLAKLHPETNLFLTQGASSAPDDAANWDDQSIANLLRSIWIPQNGHASDSIDELKRVTVLNAVKRLPWCLSVAEAGLLGHKDDPCLAVTPDGFAKVKRPDSQDTVVASCVMQQNDVVPNNDVHFESYFECTVGDRVWWTALSEQSRAQVVHQAMVLGLSYVLFIMVDGENVHYACLVSVSNGYRLSYNQAIAKWSHLFNWAYATAGAMQPAPPLAFSAQNRIILLSHFQLWRAQRDIVVSTGPVHPLDRYKSALQTVHETMESGLVRSSEHMDELAGHKWDELTFTQQLAIDGLRHMVANSYALNELYRVHEEGTEWETMTDFYKLIDAGAPLCDFRNNLATSLFQFAAEMRQAGPSPQAVPIQAATESLLSAEIDDALKGMPRHTRLIQSFFNNGKPQNIRLSKSLSHEMEALRSRDGPNATNKKKVQICAYCGGYASSRCATCRVALHVTLFSGEKLTCTNKWHSQNVITVIGSRKMRSRRLKDSSDASHQHNELSRDVA